MHTQIVVELTKNLGFSEKKAQVFVALLQLGETTASAIALKSKLKRTTVYNILPELIADGLVAQSRQSRLVKYFVTDPRVVLDTLSQKIDSVKQLVPLLESLHTLSTASPKIQIYEGLQGAQQVYDDVLLSTSTKDRVIGFIGNIPQEDIPKHVLSEYIRRRMQKKIQNQVIMIPGTYATYLQKDASDQLREVRLLGDIPKTAELPAVDVKIYANKIAIISYRENFLAIVIESVDISQMFRILFDSFWNLLKKI